MRLIALLNSIFFCGSGFAHHSAAVHFDLNDVVEIVGILSEVQWQNPHVQLKVTTLDENGNEVVWLVEEVGVNEQLRRGVTSERYRIGEEIRVAGPRGRRNRTAILATNTLLVADGVELTSPGRRSRWSAEVINTREQYQATQTENSSATATGLFRVWSRYLSDGPGQLWNESYPLTEQARTTKENWNAVDDNPYMFCQTGMPAIMDSGYPIEILPDGDDILIRVEELDSTRRVHMTDNAPRSAQGPFGHSVGRWESEILVVTTTEIDFPWFDQDGTPQSEALTLEERFWVSGERFLNLEMTAVDSAVFTEPVVLDRRWVWVPEVEIRPYNCIYERDDL